jgi:hypothetical protein
MKGIMAEVTFDRLQKGKEGLTIARKQLVKESKW